MNQFVFREYCDWLFESIEDRSSCSPAMIQVLLVKWASALESNKMKLAFASVQVEMDPKDPEDGACMDLLTLVANKKYKTYNDLVASLQSIVLNGESWFQARQAKDFYFKSLYAVIPLSASVVGGGAFYNPVFYSAAVFPLINFGLWMWYGRKSNRLLRSLI